MRQPSSNNLAESSALISLFHDKGRALCTGALPAFKIRGGRILITKKHRGDLIIALSLILVLLIFISQLPGITPVARQYPLVVIIGSFIMIAIVSIQAILRSKKDAAATKQQTDNHERQSRYRIIVYSLVILAYVLMLDLVGYFIATIGFMVFSLMFQKQNKKILIIVFPLVFSVVLYFVFSKLLYVTLPNGLLFDMLV